MEYIGGVTEETKKQYIVVKIGSEQYGIDISYIDNIVTPKIGRASCRERV